MGAHWELSGSSLGALWELFRSLSQLRVYGEDVFLEIGTGSVYFKTVALAAAYLACMSILYNKFGVENCHSSPSSRHS
jgi:hypothetical protein